MCVCVSWGGQSPGPNRSPPHEMWLQKRYRRPFLRSHQACLARVPSLLSNSRREKDKWGMICLCVTHKSHW